MRRVPQDGGEPHGIQASAITFRPLSAATWTAFTALFGANGACGGCWCMLWRVPSREWKTRQGAANRAAMRRLAHRGPPPGVLAFAGDEPVGWCAVAPRAAYVRLERSRAMRAIDDEPVWSISCLFVAKRFRRRKLSSLLLRAATELAAGHGARIVEGYPVEPRHDAMPDVFAWTGTASAFRAAGFEEVRRWLPSRPIMRVTIG